MARKLFGWTQILQGAEHLAPGKRKIQHLGDLNVTVQSSCNSKRNASMDRKSQATRGPEHLGSQMGKLVVAEVKLTTSMLSKLVCS